jgi:hypothetical protein
MVADARRSGSHVYPLSFHVDYWNRLGWTDPFSDPSYSERQRAYADAMKLSSVYTPQMILNGTDEFVGSDRDRSAAAVARALKTEASVAIDITLAEKKPGMLTVSCALSPTPADAKLNVALVERGIVTKVARGENGGRELRHENVVRAFSSAAVKTPTTPTTEISIPPGVRLKNASVIVYVQDKASLAVLGASEIDATPPAAATTEQAR